MTRSARAAALRWTALAQAWRWRSDCRHFGGAPGPRQKFRCRSRGRSRATSFPKPRPLQARSDRAAARCSAAARGAGRIPARHPPARLGARDAPARRPARGAQTVTAAAMAATSSTRRPTPTRWKTSSSWCASRSRRMRRRPRPRYPIRSPASSPNGSSCAATTTALRSSAIAPSSSANPSWPSQTFLRRRIEAALWDDRRDDATVLVVVRKRKAAVGQRQVLAGEGDDRARRSRQCRTPGARCVAARRHVGGHRETALDLFGALLTPGDHKARMDLMLYGSEQEAAGMRAAKRLGAGQVALAKARNAANKKGSNLRALLDAVPRELHGDPGYMFARIQLLRREEKFAEAAQLMLAAPKDPNRLHNLDEWWIERRLLARKMLDVGEHRSAYLIARDAALPVARHLQDRAGIHRGLDRAALPERSGGRRPAFCAHRRRQRQPDRAGARRLLAGPRGGSRRPRPGGPRRLRRGRRAVDQLLRPAGARQTRIAADRIERRARRGRGVERLEIVRAVQLLYELRRARDRDPDFRRHGRERRSRRAGRARRTGLALHRRPRHAAARQGRAQSRPAVRLLRLSRQRHPVVQADRPRGRAEHRLRHRPAGKRLQPGGGLAGAGLRADAGDAGCRTLCLQAGTAPASTSAG